MRRDVVLILLFDREGRFLLQHRDDNAPSYPGYWGFFGGGIEEGETPVDAVRREAAEELRYTPTATAPVLIVEYGDGNAASFGRKFYFAEVCPDKSALELHEGQGMDWFTMEEARNLKITENNLRVIESIITIQKDVLP